MRCGRAAAPRRQEPRAVAPVVTTMTPRATARTGFRRSARRFSDALASDRPSRPSLEPLGRRARPLSARPLPLTQRLLDSRKRRERDTPRQPTMIVMSRPGRCLSPCLARAGISSRGSPVSSAVSHAHHLQTPTLRHPPQSTCARRWPHQQQRPTPNRLDPRGDPPTGGSRGAPVSAHRGRSRGRDDL